MEDTQSVIEHPGETDDSPNATLVQREALKAMGFTLRDNAVPKAKPDAKAQCGCIGPCR